MSRLSGSEDPLKWIQVDTIYYISVCAHDTSKLPHHVTIDKLFWPYQINTNHSPSQGDLAGWKNKNIYYVTICIIKISMVVKYLDDTTSVHS